MRVQIDDEEAWAMLSTVMQQVLEDGDLSDEDRAALRRWRSEQMRPGRDASKALLERLNQDLERLMKGKERSRIQKHDWV
jgi:ferric-dicitrate binding protein FerR (iron transport regulator)